MPERVLVLQHEPAAPAASLGEWARERGFEVEVLEAHEEWEVPDLSDSVAFVASLGSPDHAYDDEVPWLARELEVLARAHAAELPVYGICFGSQSLARSLGAPTRLADEPEIGWYEVEARAPEEVPKGPWLFWHEDCFELPPGAELLARTPAGPAAFRSGRSVGIQFHPEATPKALEDWIDHSGAAVDPAVLEGMRRGFEVDPEGTRERAWRLYDAFLAGLRR
jgi:GMP synthase-like glutamine amidotransferase